MKKEHPIIMSTPMVQAILEGRKTQTRRIIKPQPIDNTEIDGNFFEGNDKGYVKVDGHPNWQWQFAYEFCRYNVGDTLWVRETYQHECEEIQIAGGDWSNAYLNATGNYVYKADNILLPAESVAFGKWKPSIFMPRSAARIFLEIKNIRVERLQDISEQDAEAEGVEQLPFDDSYKQPFQHLWQSINGAGSWSTNPFVWVIEFTVKK